MLKLDRKLNIVLECPLWRAHRRMYSVYDNMKELLEAESEKKWLMQAKKAAVLNYFYTNYITFLLLLSNIFYFWMGSK